MQILDINQVVQKTRIARATVYRYIKQGKFPASVRIGERAVGWVESEVDAWLEERVKASREHGAAGVDSTTVAAS